MKKLFTLALSLTLCCGMLAFTACKKKNHVPPMSDSSFTSEISSDSSSGTSSDSSSSTSSDSSSSTSSESNSTNSSSMDSVSSGDIME
ncbi:MAG: hypothetical protein E7352_04435 [Clostridiales bacterium]|nr:hypothetical protein [Clostridiales bacterium]